MINNKIQRKPSLFINNAIRIMDIIMIFSGGRSIDVMRCCCPNHNNN